MPITHPTHFALLKRQRVALAVLSRFGKGDNRRLGRIRYVKLMFLLRQERELIDSLPSFYDFLPYKLGPYSFSLYSELGKLSLLGCLDDSDEKSFSLYHDQLNSVERIFSELPEPLLRVIAKLEARYKNLDDERLIAAVYKQYPEYTVNSERHWVPRQDRPPPAKIAIYTAGYQGISVDAFLHQLLQHGILNIIDVRANPLSRRYGLSKRELARIADKIGLEYQHFPALGIPGSRRRDLSDSASYRRLLSWYRCKLLPEANEDILQVGKLMSGTPSVLICFEEDHRCCHRSPLADAIAKSCKLEVEHLNISLH